MVTTKIINRTTKRLKLKVGNNRTFRDIATIQKDGGVHEISADPSATYQEYCIAVVDAVEGKQFVVNSDECVDNKSITIVEADSKFNVVKEPRQSLIRGFCEQGLIRTTSLLFLGCVFHGVVFFSVRYMGKSALYCY